MTFRLTRTSECDIRQLVSRLTALVNGTVYTPHEKVIDGAVLIDGYRIRSVGRMEELDIPVDATRIDAQQCAIVPGLIDLHTYGCFGAQLTAPDRAAEDLGRLAQNVARFGVTRFLISPPMGDLPFLREMLAAIAAAIPELTRGARCMGIHLEGPYLDPERHGAFPRAVLREPSVEEVARLVEVAGGCLRLVTMAPNMPGSLEVAHFLRSRGIVVSLGHSEASFAQAFAALAPQGDFTLVTHIFNAMSGLDHYAPGVAAAALLSDVPVMLICDGEHVHPDMIKLLWHIKKSDGIVLVTDSISGAGLGDGEYSLFGQKVTVRGRRVSLPDGGLAASVLTLNRAVVNVRSFTGMEFGEALAMATANPARLLGCDDCGVLREGAPADVVMMDEESGLVKRTMVRGETDD